MSEEEIERQVRDTINSGNYKMVSLDIFESIKNIKLEDNTKNILEGVLEDYQDYLELMNKLNSELKNQYLKTIKNNDIIDNQSLEQENSFLIEIYMQLTKKNAVDEIIESNKKLTKENMINTHRILLKGTESEGKSYRTSNRKFVGTWINGERNIQYFPLDYKNIDKAIDELVDIYNEDENEEQNIFVKPFIIHGLISVLQLFEDGNTRLARLYQHIKIWELTNKIYKTDLISPALFTTKTYVPYRGEYRNILKDIAINPSSENWNSWIRFNLRRMQDQLYKNVNNIESLLARVNKK